MIITRNWLNEWINLEDLSNKEIYKALDNIGLEVDSMTELIIPSKIVVGYVKECVKHPDANKLSITKVDIGGSIVQIVCGAKNVRAGLFVPVALIGSSFGDFKIVKTELRGEESSGMICSSKELGLPDINDGILELDSSIGELVVGKELKEYSLLNDTVYEIELTANRGDCLSIYGVARDLATYLKKELLEFEKIESQDKKGIGRILEINSENIDSKLCFRVFESSDEVRPDLNIKLKNMLVGNTLSNDVRDIVKYVSHSTGVLFKVYSVTNMLQDDNKTIKFDIKKNKFGMDSVFLNNKEISTIGIYSDKFEASIEDRLFVLQSSYTNPDLISKLVYENKLKISDDQFYRSSRGTEYRTGYAQDFFHYIVFNESIKWYSGEERIEPSVNRHTIDVNLKKVRSLIGQEIDKGTIISILKSLQFEIELSKSNEDFAVNVPIFRNDIKNIQDITEEIIRIVGIDNIDSNALEFKEKNRINSAMLNFHKTNSFRSKATSNGFFENLSFVFTDKTILEKYSFDLLDKKFELLNPISSELNTLRSTILINLLQSAKNNTNIGKKSIKLFEIGKTFNQNRDEFTKISFIFSGKRDSENVSNHGKPQDISFFEFAKKISSVIGDFEIKKTRDINKDFFNPYEYGEIFQNGEKIGIISKLGISVQKDFDLGTTYVCECDFTKIQYSKINAQNYSKFQLNTRELSLLVPSDMAYENIKTSIAKINIPSLIDFYPVDLYRSDELENKLSISIKFEIQSNDKTLRVEEIDDIMNTILKTLKADLNIDLR
ncbi:MAG: Phenylalanyl-tRNA synthetase beta chain (EC [uncultured Campylobacterales bacterium]|uniref:Phenylalanine--tRNA ligase beta subunit n=1 Tax=uncultured Campylobacterales bacterium TaxID=352960 RepID=A0A6S6SV57_9BACT|nr:MAG: Phenylalanyl-tRNA synthetase beta chain (EC [uncultured Campylobacterales bacterium]